MPRDDAARNRSLDEDTVRRMAREVVGLELSDEEIPPLRELLDALNGEINDVTPAARGEAEPDVAFTLEEWSR